MPLEIGASVSPPVCSPAPAVTGLPEREAGPGRQHRRRGAPVLADQDAAVGPALGTHGPAAVLQGSLTALVRLVNCVYCTCAAEC